MTPEQTTLVLEHRWWAWKIARRYLRPNRWHTLEELRAAAEDGLIRAAQKFDPTRGIPFRFYAQFQVRSEIRQFLMRHTSTVRANTRAVGRAGGFVLHNDAPYEDEAALLMTIEDPEAIIDAKRAVTRGFRALTTTERRILVGQYVDDLPSQQLGQELRVSGARVRQIRDRAVERMRDVTWIDDQNFDDVELTDEDRAAAKLANQVARALSNEPVHVRELRKIIQAPSGTIGAILMRMQESNRARYITGAGWVKT